MSARHLEAALGAAIALVASAAWIWGIPAWVEPNDFVVVSPALLPRVAVGAIAVLGAAMCGQRLLLDRGEGPPLEVSPRQLLAGAGLIVIFGLACWAILTFGYLAGGVALVAVLMLFMGERRPLIVALVSLGAPAALYGFFDLLLGTPLP